MTEQGPSASPPPELPADPQAYWGMVSDDLVPVEDNPRAELPVLDQLGAAPFKKPEKGGFPFLGFFASVFEHVSSTAVGEMNSTGGIIGPE